MKKNYLQKKLKIFFGLIFDSYCPGIFKRVGKKGPRYWVFGWRKISRAVFCHISSDRGEFFLENKTKLWSLTVDNNFWNIIFFLIALVARPFQNYSSTSITLSDLFQWFFSSCFLGLNGIPQPLNIQLYLKTSTLSDKFLNFRFDR